MVPRNMSMVPRPWCPSITIGTSVGLTSFRWYLPLYPMVHEKTQASLELCDSYFDLVPSSF